VKFIYISSKRHFRYPIVCGIAPGSEWKNRKRNDGKLVYKNKIKWKYNRVDSMRKKGEWEAKTVNETIFEEENELGK
jgi:hypothetical protein